MHTVNASQKLMQMPVDYWGALARYQNDFFLPFSKSVQYFQTVETKKMLSTAPWRSFWDYMALLELSAGIAQQADLSSAETLWDYYLQELDTAFRSWPDAFAGADRAADQALAYLEHKTDTRQALAHEHPQAIRDIADEFGFHFEREGNSAKIKDWGSF